MILIDTEQCREEFIQGLLDKGICNDYFSAREEYERALQEYRRDLYEYSQSDAYKRSLSLRIF